MNSEVLTEAVQAFINTNIKADATTIALAKSRFEGISGSEIAGQIASKRKSATKLPTWYGTPGIYFPPLLSIEQCSSEVTAANKSTLAIGKKLVDLTAGFGVDSYYFSKKAETVYSCEINPELSSIAAHNATVLGATSIYHLPVDGIEWLKTSNDIFDTIYIDPARRLNSGKVFKLKDCTPDVVENLTMLLGKASRIIIKSAPLLDISAGLSELQNVSEIHIVSLKNECKELLWVIDSGFSGIPKICCTTLNDTKKSFDFSINEISSQVEISTAIPEGFLYEPDVAILKSGAFNLIGNRFGLKKLSSQSHLYESGQLKPDFPGRIFQIEKVTSLNSLKKNKNLVGNVVVRNFPEKAENLVKKYKISSSNHHFIIFTQVQKEYMAISCKIIQHY